MKAFRLSDFTFWTCAIFAADQMYSLKAQLPSNDIVRVVDAHIFKNGAPVKWVNKTLRDINQGQICEVTSPDGRLIAGLDLSTRNIVIHISESYNVPSQIRANISVADDRVPVSRENPTGIIEGTPSLAVGGFSYDVPLPPGETRMQQNFAKAKIAIAAACGSMKVPPLIIQQKTFSKKLAFVFHARSRLGYGS